MRQKLPISMLLCLTFLVACQREATPTVPQATLTPSIAGLDPPEIDPAIAGAIREHLGPFLGADTYTEYPAGSQLLMYLVSSAAFDQAEIRLTSGETYQADVLYAYALMNTQRVLQVPVVVGLALPDGRYTYFSEKYADETEANVITTGTPRQIALADARARLPSGRIFRLLAYGMVTREGLDWKKCPSVPFYPPEICQVGAFIEQRFPHQTRAFVLKLADEFPPNWLLLGWVFQEFLQGDLAPGASIDIPLPTPSQP